MNDRIRKLVEHTGIVITTKGMEHIVDGCYIVSPNKLDKFAQLIVAECASLCLDMKYTNPQPHHYAVMIKEHFGVD